MVVKATPRALYLESQPRRLVMIAPCCRIETRSLWPRLDLSRCWIVVRPRGQEQGVEGDLSLSSPERLH
jgi:hypothetical protein